MNGGTFMSGSVRMCQGVFDYRTFHLIHWTLFAWRIVLRWTFAKKPKKKLLKRSDWWLPRKSKRFESFFTFASFYFRSQFCDFCKCFGSWLEFCAIFPWNSKVLVVSSRDNLEKSTSKLLVVRIQRQFSVHCDQACYRIRLRERRILDTEVWSTSSVWTRSCGWVRVSTGTASSCHGAFVRIAAGTTGAATLSCWWVAWGRWARVGIAWWRRLLSGWVWRVWVFIGTSCSGCWCFMNSVNSWVGQTTLNND